MRGVVVEPEGEYFTYKEAAARLEVCQHTIRTNVHVGIISAIRKDGKAYLEAAEVEKWHRFFTTINPPFMWLEYDATSRHRLPPTIPIVATARILGISSRTLERWMARDLIPFFPVSFTIGGGTCHKGILREYVEGLKNYSLRPRVTISIAHEYLEYCQSKNRIV